MDWEKRLKELREKGAPLWLFVSTPLPWIYLTYKNLLRQKEAEK